MVATTPYFCSRDFARCVAACWLALAVTTPTDAQSRGSAADHTIEELLLGTWIVQDREFEVGDVLVRHIDGKIHVADRKPDGTYTVLVTLSSHFRAKDGSGAPLPECDGKPECILASGTEGVGVYTNGRFFIDYFGENWIDDLFTISDFTMRGWDVNGPIVLTKVDRDSD